MDNHNEEEDYESEYYESEDFEGDDYEEEDYDDEIEDDSEDTDTDSDAPDDRGDEEEDEDDDLVDEEEIDESDEEEWAYPDYVPDELVVPEEFKNEKEELQWYRENYFKSLEVPNSENFKKVIANKYKDYLIQAEDEFDKLTALKEAFDTNPRGLFKMYFGTELEKAGVEFKLSAQERSDIVARKLADEFGEDYFEVYDEEKAMKPNTIHHKIWKRNNELFEEINKETKEETVDYAKLIDETYEKEFSDFERQEYDEFVEKAKTYNMGLRDLYIAMHYKELSEQSYQEGLKQGKKEVMNQLKPQAKRVRRPVKYKEEDEPVEHKASDSYGFRYL